MKTKQQNTDSIIALAASIREQANILILQALSERGITDILLAHGAVLHALFQHGSLLMSELAQVIGRKKNTVTGLINTLEERGFCRREADPQDARAQRVVLTDRGESMRAVQAEVSEKLLLQLWQDINKQDQQACVRVLQKVLNNLEKCSPD